MRFCKKVIDEFLTWKWSLFCVLLLIFGYVQRQNLIESSIFLKSRINQWDILIGISCDPILLIYLLLPYMLFLSCLTIRETWNNNHLVRVRSWVRCVRYSVKMYSPTAVVSVLLLLVIALLLTQKLPYELTWSAFSSLPSSSFNSISSFSKETNMSPLVVLAFQLFLLYIFLLTVHAFLATLSLYFSKLLYLGIVSLAILLYTMVTFRYYSDLPRLVVFNYMTFPSSYSVYHVAYPAFVILIGVQIISIYVVPLFKKIRISVGSHVD